MQGRFDLPVPEGTCYLASTAQAAARERVGPDIAASGRVADSILRDRVVSALELPADARAANLDSDRASDRYGITAELSVMTPYAVPQAWAVALRSAGFDGIVGQLRFTLSRHHGLALFGQSGARPDWRSDPAPQLLVDVVRDMGVRVISPPDDDQVSVIAPQ